MYRSTQKRNVNTGFLPSNCQLLKKKYCFMIFFWKKQLKLKNSKKHFYKKKKITAANGIL